MTHERQPAVRARVGACIQCVAMMAAGAMTPAAYADIPASERLALQAIYTSADGANWFNSDNWNGPAGSECTWHGVYCNLAGTNVSLVLLAHNNLSGSIPALEPLTQLEIFDVNRNQLTGSIPTLSGLAQLYDFEVWDNQLTGSLPSLAGLAGLGSFYAFNNKLTGTIPPLDGLTSLTEFHVYGNQFTGTIPSLTGLASLSEFEVNDNLLTGPIPDLAGLPLTVLRVGGNQLDGALPAAPVGLQAGASSLCVNHFPGSSYVDNAAWDAATGASPWYMPCNVVFANGFQGP